MDRGQANGAVDDVDDQEAGATIDRREEELALARARFHESLEALHLRFDELRDWRAWFRRHPLPFLLTAAAAGILLGLRRHSR
jgi:hypothetical protein